jgi:type VI protein secretion system component VasK
MFIFNGYHLAILFFTVIGSVWLYLLPSAIAYSRYHKNFTLIFLLNLFLGLSVLGWLVALVWSLTNAKRKEQEDIRDKEKVRQRLKEIV